MCEAYERAITVWHRENVTSDTLTKPKRNEESLRRHCLGDHLAAGSITYVLATYVNASNPMTFLLNNKWCDFSSFSDYKRAF